MTTRERDFPFTLTRDASQVGDGLTFEGYAAVFNTPTHINDQDGEYDEVIAPGAFKRSISRGTPMLMFNHGKHPLIGEMPLGVITDINEDDRGLFVRARLSNNWLIQPVRDAIAEGSISGMSFRFEVVKDSWAPRTNQPRLRTLREVKMPELGPVIWPAYSDTTASVRAAVVRSSLTALQTVMPEAVQVFAPPSSSTAPEAVTNSINPTFTGSVTVGNGSGASLTIAPGSSLTIGAVTTTETTLADTSARGTADTERDEDDDSVTDMVADAVKTLWGVDPITSGLHVFEANDSEVVFAASGAEIDDHKGLWRVGFTYDNGTVTIGDPELLPAFLPRDNTPAGDATRDAATDQGPSNEPASNGPSNEPAPTDTDGTPPPARLNADHNATMRYVHLSRHGLLTEGQK